jgi:competence protein ComEA
LATLPGIGPSKAAAIIENRPYASVDDLERVPGIGAKTIERLRDLIVAQ